MKNAEATDMKFSRFITLQKGLKILKDFKPSYVDIEPIPSSFPNGAPNHAKGAYLAVCIENWPMPEQTEELMKEMGWKMEQEGYWWVFE